MDDNRCCRFPSSYPPCLRVRYHPLSTIPLLRLDLVASDYTLQGFARNSVVAIAARSSSSSQQLAAAHSSSSSSSQQQQQQRQLAAAAAAARSSGSGGSGGGHILAFRSSVGRTHGGTWSWAASSVWRARAANDSSRASGGSVCPSRGATGPPRALACAAF